MADSLIYSLTSVCEDISLRRTIDPQLNSNSSIVFLFSKEKINKKRYLLESVYVFRVHPNCFKELKLMFPGFTAVILLKRFLQRQQFSEIWAVLRPSRILKPPSSDAELSKSGVHLLTHKYIAALSLLPLFERNSFKPAWLY